MAETRAVLGDPKKLRTPRGYGYLVGRNNRIRTEGESRARAFAERLLADEVNVQEFRAALGRPEASLAELRTWLATGLASGALALLRTGPKVPALRSPHPEVPVDLIDEATRGDRGAHDESASSTTFVSVEVVDDRGRRPGAGELRFSLNGSFSSHGAFERAERKRIHPSSQAGAGCLDLDFDTPAPQEDEFVSPLGPDALPPDRLSFEVVTPQGEPVPVAYELMEGQVPLAAGTTADRVVVESVHAVATLKLEF